MVTRRKQVSISNLGDPRDIGNLEDELTEAICHVASLVYVLSGAG